MRRRPGRPAARLSPVADAPNSQDPHGEPEEVEGVIVGDVRRLPGRRTTGEIVATQAAVVGGSFVAGAVAAAFAAFVLVGPEGITVVQLEPGKIFLAEIIFTAALAYVVLNVATGKKAEGNSYYGLAIGATVMVGALSVGPISGGAFNPAVAVAACVSGLFAWSQLWIYIVACLAGGVIGALAFKAASPDGD